MKLNSKQKIKAIEEWLDKLRAKEGIFDKDVLTVLVGNCKVFLDKSNKLNDKVLIDYIIIKRSEFSMVETRMIDAIHKLTTIETKLPL